jgi:hypothetical protein
LCLLRSSLPIELPDIWPTYLSGLRVFEGFDWVRPKSQSVGQMPQLRARNGHLGTHLLGGLSSFKDWLRFGTNFLYFVREPGQVELCRGPWFDF